MGLLARKVSNLIEKIRNETHGANKASMGDFLPPSQLLSERPRINEIIIGGNYFSLRDKKKGGGEERESGKKKIYHSTGWWWDESSINRNGVFGS